MSQSPPMPEPIRFRPECERPADDEAQTVAALLEAMTRLQRLRGGAAGCGVRSMHGECLGLLMGELRVHGELPPELAQGLFARPAVHPAVLRLSTTPADDPSDALSAPRGLAIKVVGVAGEALPESESSATQDFLLVDSPVFDQPDATAVLARVRQLLAAAARPKPQAQAQAQAQAQPPSVGSPARHVLGESFYSQVPLRYGEHMAKLSVVPVSAGLIGLTGTPIDLHSRPDALRAAVLGHFARQGGTWELRVQLCTDLERMPIEDACAVWPESLSPYRTVATLVASPQSAWNEARERSIEHAMSFNPWNALAAHRPLGGVMRVRQAVYAAAVRSRHARRSEPGDQSQLLRHLGASGQRHAG